MLPPKQNRVHKIIAKFVGHSLIFFSFLKNKKNKIGANLNSSPHVLVDSNSSNNDKGLVLHFASLRAIEEMV